MSSIVPRVLEAHEVGTTRVEAAFTHDDSYPIAVTADASAVLGRLELAEKRPLSSLASAAEYQRAFDALCNQLTRHVSISFDGVESAPHPTCAVDAATSDPTNPFDVLGVTVTLRGTMPRGARSFRWRYGLTSASYALTVTSGSGTTSQATWLEATRQRYVRRTPHRSPPSVPSALVRRLAYEAAPAMSNRCASKRPCLRRRRGCAGDARATATAGVVVA